MKLIKIINNISANDLVNGLLIRIIGPDELIDEDRFLAYLENGGKKIECSKKLLKQILSPAPEYRYVIYNMHTKKLMLLSSDEAEFRIIVEK